MHVRPRRAADCISLWYRRASSEVVTIPLWIWKIDVLPMCVFRLGELATVSNLIPLWTLLGTVNTLLHHSCRSQGNWRLLIIKHKKLGCKSDASELPARPTDLQAEKEWQPTTWPQHTSRGACSKVCVSYICIYIYIYIYIYICISISIACSVDSKYVGLFQVLPIRSQFGISLPQVRALL